jgi:hypothetical protein
LHSNLDTLKREIADALQSEDFAVFYGSAHPMEDTGTVYWDSERNPDYRAFLAAAHKVGARMIIFSEREFQTPDIDQALEEMEDCEISHEERRSFERKLRSMRVFEGRACAVRLTFHYENRAYVFELRTEWFDEFLQVSEEIDSRLPDDDDEDEDDSSLGGYYSKN